MIQLWASWGAGVFRVEADGHGPNATQAQVSQVVHQARMLRQLSWCVTVVVVSDDPAFLAAFADLSYKSGLLVWPTRLLVVTHLPLPELQNLREALSMTNSMLLIVKNTTSSPRFLSSPTLVVAVEIQPYHTISMLESSETLGGDWVTLTGTMADLVDYMSESMNFSYRYLRSTTRGFGSKQDDGSWTGMIGLVMREEADFATGPFVMSPARGEVVDFCWPLWTDNLRIMGARGRPEVDPWGFLLPLALLVWVAILTALLAVPTVLFLLSHAIHIQASLDRRWLSDVFVFIRILLQQDISVTMVWVWEQLVLGVWMMMTLVLTRSYAGNLMSLLAVRHIPQPYENLQDILDDSSIIMIWQKNSKTEQHLRTVKSGIFREIADLEVEGRIKFLTLAEFRDSVDTLVRQGDHIIVDVGVTQRNLVVQDFSRTGRCDFYMSKDGFLPLQFALVVQKKSPLSHALSKRSMTLVESGIFRYWYLDRVPNSTYCRYPPKKIIVNSSLSAANLWGMFMVLVGGHFCGVLLLCLEMVVAPSLHFQDLGKKWC
ncbi:probable glutamate receptor [Panulirus ornatus]|uniref:probable glutamate receptor n=1 Tax=Panulirus ornatus TaxID=150431 RepID=UPI003A8408DB